MASPRPTGSDSVQRSDGGTGRFLSRQEATGTYAKTTRIDRLDVVQDFGAIADAVGITDAVTSNGSAVLTSGSGIFTSGMVGKAAVIAGAGAAGAHLVTAVLSYQSPTQVTLAAAASGAAVVSGGPNVNAIIGTDNSAAFAAAFTSAAATQAAAASIRQRYITTPQVYAPAGNYLALTGVPAFDVQGMSLRGAGTNATRIWFTGTGPFLSMGTFNASASDAYQGKGFRFRLSDLTLADPTRQPLAWEAARVGIGLQDNGSGEAFVDNVVMRGYSYGFYGTSGTDFSRFSSNVYFGQCDVGAYFGPGSQQIYLAGCDFFGNLEGLVIEGAPQGTVVGCSWENNKTADVTFDGKASGTTRAGLAYNISGATYWGPWQFLNCWFETGAGVDTSRNNSQNILISSVGSSTGWTGLSFRDCYLVSGGSAQVGGAGKAFIQDQGTISGDPLIDNLRIRGNYINIVYNYTGAGSTSSPVIRETPIPPGSNISYIGNKGGGRLIQTGGSITGGVLMFAPFAGTTGLQLAQFGTGRQSGTTPLLKVRTGDIATTVSGIAQGGAFLEAYNTVSLAANGAVTVDASTGNTWRVTLGANATSSSITNPTIAGQVLTIVWLQDASGSRTYAWPSNCKFAGGAAPTASTTGGYADSVTFVYDGTNWIEQSRSIGIR